MEDKSISKVNHSEGISEGLQRFIDSMVEEIVLEGKPFDKQKKYLRKYSENESIDYDKLEADINTFLEILQSLKFALNKLQVKLAEEKGRECHISEGTIRKLVTHSSRAKQSVSDKPVEEKRVERRNESPYQKIGLYGVICLFLLGMVYLLLPLFNKENSSGPSEHQGIHKDTVVVVKRDTIVKIQYRTETEQKFHSKKEMDAKTPRVIEMKIPTPNWNGKVLNGVTKDNFKLREVKKEVNPGRWNSLSNKEWLKENNLKMEYISYTKNPNGKFEGEKPLNIDMGIFPAEYKGRPLKRYEYNGDICTAFYADEHWDYNFLLLLDIKKNTLFKIDFTSFSKAPYTKPGDEQFVTQGVRYPHLKDNILYVQHGHTTYAYSSGNKNAYISAIDINNGNIIWTTQPLTCNSDFIIIDNTIICGYGFSAEPDYVYLIDLATGKRRQKIKIESAADYVVRKNDQVFVLSYGEHYVYSIVK